MALQINKKLTTDEGFEVSNAFAYLNIFILAPNSNWVNLSYYKSQQDWVDGKSPLNVSSLPNQVQTELTVQEFWGQVALVVHEKCVAQIEQVLGEDSVTIIQ
jgi:hypothetical protein